MKNNIWNAKVLGIGVLTPALLGQPQAAIAHLIDSVEAALTEPGSAAIPSKNDSAKARLRVSILDLTTEEKLKLGGSVIPYPPVYWARNLTKSPNASTPAVKRGPKSHVQPHIQCPTHQCGGICVAHPK
jgi:hypothetical protein